MPKGLGKGYKDLTNEEKQMIVQDFNDGIQIKDLIIKYQTTRRAVPEVLKEANINTKRKNKYTVNSDYFEQIDTEEKAYWLGFLYADGYVGDEKHNNIVIGLCSKDIDHLEAFKEAISFTGDIRIKTDSGGYDTKYDGIVLNFSDKKMAADLRALGLYPGKSTTMEQIPRIPEELIKHFIRGYFDGDGSITDSVRSTSKNWHSFIMTMIGTVKFLDDIKNYLPVKVSDQHCKTSGMKYIRCQNKKDMQILYEYFYNEATIYLKRKYDIWKRIKITEP